MMSFEKWAEAGICKARWDWMFPVTWPRGAGRRWAALSSSLFRPLQALGCFGCVNAASRYIPNTPFKQSGLSVSLTYKKILELSVYEQMVEAKLLNSSWCPGLCDTDSLVGAR